MRRTLRRSCAACAKAKHSCDLRTPKCSRCVKRTCSCIYANEPLTSTNARLGGNYNETQTPQALKSRMGSASLNGLPASLRPDLLDMSTVFGARSFDPFDTYPSTNLPRLCVQGLIQHFLSKIAFEYYPLDLNPASNPFIVSWWPLALTDPALFHVTLQTASWDDERQARNGFPQSERLMKDSVSLLRYKIQDRSLAFQDATMNAVVTLAAIEHGKGNLHVGKMHIDGVKRMVSFRGGLSEVRQTSPLTARMVSWVSMLVTGSPQFEAQDNFGGGNGVCAIHQWQCSFSMESSGSNLLDLDALCLDPVLKNILIRLRSIFGQCKMSGDKVTLSTTDLHDLTCFILHRLLHLPHFTSVDSQSATTSECLRYGAAIYMFLIHGPTYYSHANILNSLVLQLKHHLDSLISSDGSQESLLLWVLSVGNVASIGTNERPWFRGQAAAVSAALGIRCWEDVEVHLKRVLWLESRCRLLFKQTWEDIVASSSSSQSLVFAEDFEQGVILEHGGTTNFGV